MPTKARPEDVLVRLFLNSYNGGSWRGCAIDPLDQRQDGAVEVLATRADGRTLAIEHTLIESFVGEREDLERSKAFFPIEEDQTLWTPGRIIYVDVPKGVLRKGQPWQRIVSDFHTWLRANIVSFPEGSSFQTCALADTSFVLSVRVIIEPTFEGKPLIRRYGETDVPATVEKALTAKLPKLAATDANTRILLLERNQWTLDEKEIHKNVERRRESFPALASIDVWVVETVTMSPDRLSGYAEFTRYENGKSAESFAFQDGKKLGPG